MELHVSDAAYAAGMIDGEGSICLSRSLTSGKYYYLGRVVVSNTNLAVLQWFETSFGGQIYVCAEKNRHEKDCSRCWQWSIATQQGVYDFLMVVFPYLKIKRQQAEIMLVYLWHKLNDGIQVDKDLAETSYQDLGKLNGKPK